MATYPKMTLAQLRTASRQRADMVNSTFISDPELNSYINASYYELYDLLVQKYGNDYFMKEYSFQLQGNISQYPLPADFFKLLGVDLLLIMLLQCFVKCFCICFCIFCNSNYVA